MDLSSQEITSLVYGTNSSQSFRTNSKTPKWHKEQGMSSEAAKWKEQTTMTTSWGLKAWLEKQTTPQEMRKHTTCSYKDYLNPFFTTPWNCPFPSTTTKPKKESNYLPRDGQWLKASWKRALQEAPHSNASTTNPDDPSYKTTGRAVTSKGVALRTLTPQMHPHLWTMSQYLTWWTIGMLLLTNFPLIHSSPVL